MSQQQEYTSLDSVVEEEMARLEPDREESHVSNFNQNIVLLVIVLVLSALSAPWFHSDIGFAIGSFLSPFLWGFLIVAVAGLVEKVHNMIFKQPWKKVSKNYVNYSLRTALVIVLIGFIPDFLAGFKHGISNP